MAWEHNVESSRDAPPADMWADRPPQLLRYASAAPSPPHVTGRRRKRRWNGVAHCVTYVTRRRREGRLARSLTQPNIDTMARTCVEKLCVWTGRGVAVGWGGEMADRGGEQVSAESQVTRCRAAVCSVEVGLCLY